MPRRVSLIFLLFLAFSSLKLFPQESDKISLDFRNQKITDILFSLAELCGKSVTFDETVTGNASFHFEDTDFDTALERFTDAFRLFVEKKGDVYNISIEIGKRYGKSKQWNRPGFLALAHELYHADNCFKKQCGYNSLTDEEKVVEQTNRIAREQEITERELP